MNENLEKSPRETMFENIRESWEAIKSGTIKPFYDSVFLMYHIMCLLDDCGYIDGRCDDQAIFVVWKIWKKAPENKILKQELIRAFDEVLQVPQNKEAQDEG